jgi:uncharacterized membrane protein (UPF0127 family)
MRWHKKTVRAVNSTRGTVVGESIRRADSPLTGIVGLLGERDLPPGDGLLIIPCQGVHTLGMLFPIDIVVLDDEWKVIEVRRDLRPFRITPLFWRAAAVLELPSRAVDSSCTRVGDLFEFSSGAKPV